MAGKQSSRIYLIVALSVFAAGAFFSGCSSTTDNPQTPSPAFKEEIRYYDRNGDGKVDLEYHHYPRIADMDWELRDDNYDGRYEKKIVYGIGVFESPVDIPAPTNATISPNPSR